jgi:nucleoside-diphosphate-sugar epimerase
MRLVDRAVRQGVKQFIFASSSSVYGVKTEPKVTEDLELLPLSEYNKTKMVAERVILSYAGSAVTTIIRPATVCGYSPRMRLDVVVNLLTMQALSGGRMTVLGGDQVRPNIHIDDLVDLYLFALEHRLGGVYNAGFENISVMDIAKAVARRCRRRLPCCLQRPAITRSVPIGCWRPVSRPRARSRTRFARWSPRTARGSSRTSPPGTTSDG